MNSILLSANQSTSRSSRSRSNWLTLAAMAEPQSQNVHLKGQPRFVSHRISHFSCWFAAIRELKMPERYGDGMTEISCSRSPRELSWKVPSARMKLTEGTCSNVRDGKFSRIERN